MSDQCDVLLQVVPNFKQQSRLVKQAGNDDVDWTNLSVRPHFLGLRFSLKSYKTEHLMLMLSAFPRIILVLSCFSCYNIISMICLHASPEPLLEQNVWLSVAKLA